MSGRRFWIVLVTVVVAAACTSLGCTSHQAPKGSPAKEDGPAQPRVADKHAPAQHEDEAEKHEALPDKIRLSPQVVQAAGIKTALAKVAALPMTVELSGELAADPDMTAFLAARVPGRVVTVHVKEGQRVKVGQPIAVLESSELARVRATLASSTARARSARMNATRLRSLESKALASGQEAASAEGEASALEAEVAAARQTLLAFGPDAEPAQGANARLTLRTPIAGFVLSRDAVRGQTVEPGHVIAVVGDLDRVYFLGRLFEKDLARVRVDAAAEVRLNAYPGEVFAGTVETIGRQLDAAARTVTARVLVKNHGDLVKVGLFGTARVVTGPSAAPRKRVVVPLSAVTSLADKNIVFVLQPDGDFEVHPVTLGLSAAGRTEVLSGLREGEQVVVEGVFTLKSAVLKSTFGEEE